MFDAAPARVNESAYHSPRTEIVGSDAETWRASKLRDAVAKPTTSGSASSLHASPTQSYMHIPWSSARNNGTLELQIQAGAGV